jgi:hypothetical protein
MECRALATIVSALSSKGGQEGVRQSFACMLRIALTPCPLSQFGRGGDAAAAGVRERHAAAQETYGHPAHTISPPALPPTGLSFCLMKLDQQHWRPGSKTFAGSIRLKTRLHYVTRVTWSCAHGGLESECPPRSFLCGPDALALPAHLAHKNGTISYRRRLHQLRALVRRVIYRARYRIGLHAIGRVGF